MTAYNVMENFKSVLEAALENVRLDNKDSLFKKPQVLLGYLEPLEVDKDEKDDFPYVLVRYIEGNEDDEENEINLKLILGVYSQDVKGWVDILHITEVIKQSILKQRSFDFYMLDGAIKTSIPEEQPFPYFYGCLDLKFKIPHTEIEGDERPWLP